LSSNKLKKEKKTDISRILSLIYLRPSKSIFAKSKFYNKNPLLSLNSKPNIKLYPQASKGDISEIIKIEEVFPKLFSTKFWKYTKLLTSQILKVNQSSI